MAYTNDDRRSMAVRLLAAQRDWAAANPNAHPGLKAADHIVTAAGTESDLGNPRFMANAFYNGVLQLNPTIPVRDTFAWPEVLQATSDSMNRIAKFNPAVLRDTGGKPWTPELVKEHYKNNIHLQVAGTLESGAADMRTMGIKVDGLSAAQQAGLIYMAHVIPQAAKIISDNLNYKGPLKDLVTADRINALPNLNDASPEKVKGWVARNPAVFFKGELSPKDTLDRWIAGRYTPVVRQFAGEINASNNTPLPKMPADTGPVVAQRVPEAWDRTSASPPPSKAISPSVAQAPARGVSKPEAAGKGLLERFGENLTRGIEKIVSLLVTKKSEPDFIDKLASWQISDGHLAKAAGNWISEKIWPSKTETTQVAEAPKAQQQAAPSNGTALPPKANGQPGQASNASPDRYATLNSMKKDPYLKSLIDNGQIRDYVAALGGEKKMAAGTLRNFQQHLKDAGVRDSNQKLIVADGEVGTQTKDLARKLKIEVAALPATQPGKDRQAAAPLTGKPKAAAVRMD